MPPEIITPHTQNPETQSFDSIEEVRDGIISKEELSEKLTTGEALILHGKRRSIAVGYGLLVKVNTAMGLSGANTQRNIDIELEKVRSLSSLGYAPDIMMDLSITQTQPPMYEQVVDLFGGPIGTLPHYLCYEYKHHLIQPDKLLAMVESQAKAGVAFMTLHPTPTRELYRKSLQERATPITSRGGGIVIDDLLHHSRRENIIAELFPEILSILKNYDMAVSIGTAFRPSNVLDALDAVHREEYERQGIFTELAKQAGVPVMMEGVGHMTLDKITEYAEMVKRYRIPFMPLGPITTDAAVGEDHISSAIGSAYMAFLGAAHVLNSITREEHTGKVPTQESIIEGVRAARIAEHTVNIAKFPQVLEPDRQVSDKRAGNYTCVVEGGLFSSSAQRRFSMGCSRCGSECPLILNQRVIGKGEDA